MKYAIIINGVVNNLAAANAEFAASQGWIECAAEVAIGWLYDGVNFTPPPENTNAKRQSNKEEAKQRLTETDWVTLPDVSSETSSPRLANIQEFYNYRNSLRAIAVDPPVEVTWPVKPTEQWQS